MYQLFIAVLTVTVYLLAWITYYQISREERVRSYFIMKKRQAVLRKLLFEFLSIALLFFISVLVINQFK